MMKEDILYNKEAEELEKEKIMIAQDIANSNHYFALKLKNGLGNEIKKNIKKKKEVKKTLFYRFKKSLNKILNKF